MSLIDPKDLWQDLQELPSPNNSDIRKKVADVSDYVDYAAKEGLYENLQQKGPYRTPDTLTNGSKWANLTLVPTETSNPDEPRTLGAGYDENYFILTVQFRDGTLYNYYDVPPKIWYAFRMSPSKGIYMQQELDAWPRKGKVQGHSTGYYARKAKTARKQQRKMYEPLIPKDK